MYINHTQMYKNTCWAHVFAPVRGHSNAVPVVKLLSQELMSCRQIFKYY